MLERKTLRARRTGVRVDPHADRSLIASDSAAGSAGVSRRFAIKSGICALLTTKAPPLNAIWQLTAEPQSAPVDAALALVRQLNTIATTHRFKSKTSTYPTQKELLTGEEGLKTYLNRFKPGTPGYPWMVQVNLDSDQILPGWWLDYDLVN